MWPTTKASPSCLIPYGKVRAAPKTGRENCVADCSMIEAFEVGGNFHSRTALGMFKYIQDALENG